MSDDSQPLTSKPKPDTIMPTRDSQVSATDLTMSKEPEYNATNSAGTAAHRTNVSPLLNLPTELRDEIYGYFIVADMDWFTWDYLIKRNLWVRVTLNKVDDPFGPRTFADKLKWYQEFDNSPTTRFDGSCSRPLYQPYFPRYEGGSPSKSSEVLASEASVSLWLGEIYDPSDNAAVDKNSTQISFMFAYEPRRYSIFIRELLDNASEYKSMTIKPSPVTVPGSTRFAKLIEPMSTIRGLDKVSFVGTADSPTIQALGQDMRLPFDSDLDAIKNARYTLDQGHAAEIKGCYSAAMRHYEFGLDHEPGISLNRLRREHAEGTLVRNSLSHIKTETCIGFSRSAHKFVAEIRQLAPGRPLHTIDGIGMWIGRSIHWAREAFAFVGMTDLQRREAHLYSALAFQTEAEFMENIPWEERYWAPISYYPFQYHWHSPVDFWDDGRESYEAAAKNLFYAKEIDPSYDILAQLDEGDRAICRQIQSPPPEGFEVLERKIPLMDDWRGDPDMWTEWCRKSSPWMKKLLEQRHIVDSGTEPESQDDLAARYSAVGVTWYNLDRDITAGDDSLRMITDNPDYQD
ncbi:hypothetical protein PG988_015832 [Apiospora saccharicola]